MLAPILLLLFFGTHCSSKKTSREELIRLKLDSLRRELSEIKKQKIELILDRLHQKELFNGCVLVVEHGKILFKKSYGYADFRNKTPLDAKSVFQIGVLSQQFTSMLIMMLAEEKRIKYEDPVYYYVKGWPYKNTTIYHLLTHTSGLTDYVSYFYSNSEDLMTYATNRDILNWVIKDRPALMFDPGTQWEFNHTDYVVLAEVIEFVTKKKFSSVLQEKILGPLNMKNTYLPVGYSNDKKIPKRVIGFRPDNQSVYDDNFLNKIYGDRGIFSTMDDLYLLDQALYLEKPMSQAMLQKAWQPVQLANGVKFPYGFGWYLNQEDQCIYHMSGWLGFKCLFLRMPGERHTIILMTNNVNPILNEIRDMLVNILLNRPHQIPG